MRRSIMVASTSIFTALSIILAITPYPPFKIPYPIIPFLIFDFAEIPIILILLLYGLPAALFSTFIYFIALLFYEVIKPPIYAPFGLGPLMRFLASLSMILGIYAGYKLFYKEKIELNPSIAPLILGIVLGMIFRVLVMSLANYVVLFYLLPGALSFAIICIEQFINKSFSNPNEAYIYLFAFIGLFNALQTIISVIPASIILKAIMKRKGKYITTS